MQLDLGALKAWRPWPVYLFAASLPFSLAAVGIAKLLLVVTGLYFVGQALLQQRPLRALHQFRAVPWILLMLTLLGLSMTYTSAPWPEASLAWAKYAKLLVLVLLLPLLRSRREAWVALGILLACQTFVMLTSYLMAAGFHVPWVPADRFTPTRMSGIGPYAAYSSYLDQSLMTVGYIAMCWHLRLKLPQPWARLAAMLLAGLGMAAVVLLLPGRSGQVALFAVFLLTLYWQVRARSRILLLLAPALVLALAVAVPSGFRDRMGLVVAEVQAYEGHATVASSSGIRLNLWQRAVQAIAERPLTGWGVASFAQQYRRLEGESADTSGVPSGHNAHQEYLQWGVQLGLGGIALMLGLMVCLVRDARRLDAPTRWATQSLIAIFGIACLFNCALFDALLGDYFCFAIGLLLALGLTEAEVGSLAPSRSLEASPA